MTEALEIDPFDSDRMMYGTGATIYGTENLTDWDTGGQFTIKPMVQGLEETAVNDLISPPSGAPLLSALGDIGGFRHTDLDQGPVDDVHLAELHHHHQPGLRRDQPEHRWSASATSTPVAHIGFSTDNGANWFAGSDPSGVTGGGTVAAASDGSRFVWSPAGTGVQLHHRASARRGPRRAASPPGAIVESDRVDPKKFYGFTAGKFYVSTDGGATFTASAATGLPSGDSVRFKALPGTEGDIWLAGGAATARTGCGTPPTPARPSPSCPTSSRPTPSASARPRPARRYQALYTSAKIGGVRGIFRSDRHGRDLDAHQRRRPPVGLDRRGHHRRPAGLRPRLRRDQRPRHHLRRQLGHRGRWRGRHGPDTPADGAPAR